MSHRWEFPVRRARGVHATVRYWPIAPGCYQAEISTRAPGWGGVAGPLPGTFPTASLAIDNAALYLARYWANRGVANIAGDVHEHLERFD